MTGNCRQPPSPTPSPPAPTPPSVAPTPTPSATTTTPDPVQVVRALDQVISLIEAIIRPEQGRVLNSCASFTLKVRRFLFAVETNNSNWLQWAGDIIFSQPPTDCSNQQVRDLTQLQSEAETIKNQLVTTTTTSTTSTTTTNTI